MLRLFLCLTLACGTLGQGTQTEYTVKPNSDYVYAELLDCNLLSMTVDGAQISGPADGSHCVPPNDCWEIVESDKVLVAEGRMSAWYAAFTVQPLDSYRSSPIIFQYTAFGTSDYPQVDAETMPVIAKELYMNETLFHVVHFNTDIKSVTAVGEFTRGDLFVHKLSTTLKRGMLSKKVLIFTGHSETRVRAVELKCQEMPISRILINPSDETEVAVTMLTFIDYVNAFKL
ncbi:hypothetical protein AAHC03_020620 [Spirometra sp. Aus1]